ncbi:alpha/beta hydrolase [Psychrosphaera aestuarii]|uniref:alpha/beta hydrolase n=1 Tax=Psychrosphaera aestuarii TaxID=1266052 RepID=UPI001B33007A|nr:alpha/beta hydrolase [Psychrosphaera aestuarii]
MAVFILSLIGSGIAYEQISRASALEQYSANGSLIDIGSRLLHVDCRGEGSPIVILESGLDTFGSLSWSAVHDQLAKKTRTCAYDRAGIMWSSPRPHTNNLMQAIANDLNKALVISNEKPPYIMVGHSFGGPYITKFTELYGDKVAGIVFVDSPHPEQMDLVQDIEVPLTLSVSNKVNKILKPVMSITGFTRLINKLDNYSFPNQSKYHQQAIKAFSPLSDTTLAQEISNYSDGLKQITSLRDFGERPMFVLGNIVNYIDMSDQQLANAGLNRDIVPAVMEQDRYMFNDQASWSSNSNLKLLHNTSHYIQFEKPTVVISAVEIVVDKVKEQIK